MATLRPTPEEKAARGSAGGRPRQATLAQAWPRPSVGKLARPRRASKLSASGRGSVDYGGGRGGMGIPIPPTKHRAEISPSP